jgi:hypothetical protein
MLPSVKFAGQFARVTSILTVENAAALFGRCLLWTLSGLGVTIERISLCQFGCSIFGGRSFFSCERADETLTERVARWARH